MNPRRIQRENAKGWRAPEGAVYVGAGSVWENPYRVVKVNRTTWNVVSHDAYPDATFWTSREARADAVARLEGLFAQDRDPWGKDRIRAELAGKHLVCWCPPDQPCHGDLLLEIANEQGADR